MTEPSDLDDRLARLAARQARTSEPAPEGRVRRAAPRGRGPDPQPRPVVIGVLVDGRRVRSEHTQARRGRAARFPQLHDPLARGRAPG